MSTTLREGERQNNNTSWCFSQPSLNVLDMEYFSFNNIKLLQYQERE